MSINNWSQMDFSKATVGVLGSHSALEICHGALTEGLPNLVVCQKGRETVYSEHYKVRNHGGRQMGCVNETVVLDKFEDILWPEVQESLLAKNVIFIPHRSFEVYVCKNDYSVLHEKFKLPIFGNRGLLQAEERFSENNQYNLLQKAGIATPKQFTRPEEIDRLVIVKVAEREREFERGFFFAQSPEDFQNNADYLVSTGKIKAESLTGATIEEFILGPNINLNFFYSPLHNQLELLGTDTRRQTSLDGFLRLTADRQSTLLSQNIQPTFEEAGHIAATVLESMLENILEMGWKFVEMAKRESAPGIIGPFALQCGIKAGPPKKELMVYDVSLRMPGSPGTKFTPYSEYLWGRQLSIGQRIAMEIKEAIKTGRVGEIVT